MPVPGCSAHSTPAGSLSALMSLPLLHCEATLPFWGHKSNHSIKTTLEVRPELRSHVLSVYFTFNAPFPHVGQRYNIKLFSL